MLAIIVFLITGAGLVLTGADIGGTPAGAHNLTGHSGLFPAGIGVALMTLQAVIFAIGWRFVVKRRDRNPAG